MTTINQQTKLPIREVISFNFNKNRLCGGADTLTRANVNKREFGPWVAHLRMNIYKVICTNTAMNFDGSAVSFRLYMEKFLVLFV